MLTRSPERVLRSAVSWLVLSTRAAEIVVFFLLPASFLHALLARETFFRRKMLFHAVTAFDVAAALVAVGLFVYTRIPPCCFAQHGGNPVLDGLWDLLP
ncbi:MAG: hypothetical protein ABL971_12595 [Vicinamibacterales bacterium]